MKRDIRPRVFLRKAYFSRPSTSWIILFFSLVIAVFVWTMSKHYFDSHAKELFESRVNENLDHIDRRMQKYENALRSGIAFFHASEGIDRQKWHQFVKALQTRKYYPGFQGIGFSMMLRPDEVTPTEQRMRDEGYSPFMLKPAGKREQYSSILYLEPMDKRNIQAIGYDMFSEPTRKEAMERARDTALPSASGRVILVQEIDSDVQPGFLMYLPLYKTEREPDTVEARRDMLLGFVYSPFRMEDLMSAVALKDSLLNFEIYDAEEHTVDDLLYRSFEPSSYISKHDCCQPLQVGGRTWHIRFSSTPAFDAATDSKYPLLLTLGGLLVYLFLLFIILSLVKNRQVLQLRTRELESNRAWLNSLLESSADGIHIVDLEGNLSAYSPSFIQMLGYNEHEARNLNLCDWDTDMSHEGIIDVFHSTSKTSLTLETRHRRKDGTVFDTEITTRMIELDNRPYIYAASRDITERKKREEAYRELSSQTEAILASVPDIIMQVNNDEVYTWSNRAGIAFFGEDVIGKEASAYFKGEQVAYNIDNPLIEGDDNITYMESWQKRFDGEIRLLAWWCRSLKDDDGNPIGALSTAQDITERKKAESQLLKLSQAVEQSPHTIVITDVDGNIEYVNAAFVTVTGYTQEEAISKNPRLLQSGKTLPATYDAMWQQLTQGKSWKGEFINHRKDGTEYIEAIKASPIFQADGKIAHYMAIKEDITEKKRDQERIHYLANFDALTGLPNRTQLEDRIKYAISLAKRDNGELAVLFLDLDHFKDINDTLGHRIGDALLIALAKRFKSILREADTISRLGGDEFIFMLSNTTMQGIAHVAQKILDSIAEPFTIDQNELTVTASIGIAIYPADGTDQETLSKNADIAMYRAKQEGRDNYCFFTEAMQEDSARNLRLTNALRHALKRNELHLVYQPQISLHDNRIIGAETLLRWHHPELGNISPAEFIPLAEESGLILPIGEWVLRSAVAQAKRWIEAGLPPMIVAVNLSAVQFRHPNLPDLVTDILETAGLQPEYLEIELTEAVAMKDPKRATAVMDSLNERGIRMSIDDFGTGYSSLSYLKKFKVYKLKIDRSFVRDIHTDPEDKAIVSAIISMANSLGLKTIAEGVETAEQLNYLRGQGCDEIQGYLYSTPLLADEFELFVKGLHTDQIDV
ncbi:EAL domain-containing protein [Sulfurimonas sp. HSL3-7]|uniref:EAL domain-containing protein n=1 Tax=Sulfonitrofixus jiaomeiensis TaxID=3131938 RepID=UPI0031F8E29F